MTAQRRRAGEVIIWDSEDPLPGRKGRRGGKKNNLKRKENLLIHRSRPLPSLHFLSCSRGICGKTGERQGRRETGLEPLKEVPLRGGTSTSQDRFSDGCSPARRRAPLHVRARWAWPRDATTLKSFLGRRGSNLAQTAILKNAAEGGN